MLPAGVLLTGWLVQGRCCPGIKREELLPRICGPANDDFASDVTGTSQPLAVLPSSSVPRRGG